MCLYPKLIRNKKYQPNTKNGGDIPAVYDTRVLHVPIGCGNCIECRKQKARNWQVRLQEEIKHNKNGKFITLTFSNESIVKLCGQIKNKQATGYELDNEIATRAVRLFMERWRKKYKKTLRHWLITELGHNGTENIHLHGIVWTNASYNTIKELWQYGYIWPRPEEEKSNFVSEMTVNYIIKYVTKTDIKHQKYKSIILTSPGIGQAYTKTINFKNHKYDNNKTNDTYRTSTGHKIALPIYYRNKAFTEEEREALWLQRLDKGERWVCGEKVKAEDDEQYWKLVQWHRERSREMGYGDNKVNWQREAYEQARREILQNKRIKNGRLTTTNNTMHTKRNTKNGNTNDKT